MISGTMFKKETLQKFHIWSESGPNDVEESVKVAYNSFIDEFVSIVSSDWRKYLNKLIDEASATFVNHITISDEAYAWWFISIKYDVTANEAARITEIGLQPWKDEQTKTKKGKHDTKQFEDEYMDRHEIIKTLRYGDLTIEKVEKGEASSGYKFWMNVFFSVFFQSKQKGVKNPKRSFLSGKDKEAAASKKQKSLPAETNFF
jgi:hypothetical protein